MQDSDLRPDDDQADEKAPRQKSERSYYYDDAYGYENYDPEDEDDESVGD